MRLSKSVQPTLNPQKLSVGMTVAIVAGVGTYGIPSSGVMRVVAVEAHRVMLECVPRCKPEVGLSDCKRWFVFQGKDKLTNGRGWFQVAKH